MLLLSRIARSSSVVSFWRGDLSAFAHKLAAFSVRTSAGHNGSFSSVADPDPATLKVHLSVEARHANVVLCKTRECE